MTRSLPPVVITGSRLLREQLRYAEQQYGLDFDYHDNIPDGRRYAVRRTAVILGSDLLALVRKPWWCRGTVLAASVGPFTARMLEHGERAGAVCAIELPAGLPMLMDAIRRADHDQPILPRQVHR